MSQLAFINNYKRRPSLRNPLFLNHILLLILLNPPFPVLLSIIYFPIALFLSFSSSPPHPPLHPPILLTHLLYPHFHFLHLSLVFIAILLFSFFSNSYSLHLALFSFSALPLPSTFLNLFVVLPSYFSSNLSPLYSAPSLGFSSPPPPTMRKGPMRKGLMHTFTPRDLLSQQ